MNTKMKSSLFILSKESNLIVFSVTKCKLFSNSFFYIKLSTSLEVFYLIIFKLDVLKYYTPNVNF